MDSSSSAALVAVAITLGCLVVALARLVAALDEADVALRGVVTGVRSIRRGVHQALSLASDVGRDVAAGEDALSLLSELKAPRSFGSPPRLSGRLAADDGAPTGPRSLVIRPHPDPKARKPRGGAAGVERRPEQRGQDRP